MDDADHDLPYVEHRPTDLTVKWCVQRCQSLGYRYAGVQDGYQCRCGNSVGKHGTGSPETCRAPCRGNRLETCGGKWRTETFLIGKNTCENRHIEINSALIKQLETKING